MKRANSLILMFGVLCMIVMVQLYIKAENNPPNTCPPHSWSGPSLKKTKDCSISGSPRRTESDVYVRNLSAVVPIGSVNICNVDWNDKPGESVIFKTCSKCNAETILEKIPHHITAADPYLVIGGDAADVTGSGIAYKIKSYSPGTATATFTHICKSFLRRVGENMATVGCGKTCDVEFEITAVGVASLTYGADGGAYSPPNSRDIYVLSQLPIPAEGSTEPIVRAATTINFTATPTSASWPTTDPAQYGDSYDHSYPYPHWGGSTPGEFLGYTYIGEQGSSAAAFTGKSPGTYAVSVSCGTDCGTHDLAYPADKTKRITSAVIPDDNYGIRKYNIHVVDPEVIISFPKCTEGLPSPNVKTPQYKTENGRFFDNLEPCGGPYDIQLTLGVDEPIIGTTVVFTVSAQNFNDCFEILDENLAVVPGNTITMPITQASDALKTYYIRPLGPGENAFQSAFTIVGTYTPFANVSLQKMDGMTLNWNQCASCEGGTSQNIGSVESAVSFGKTATGNSGGSMAVYSEVMDWDLLKSGAALTFAYTNATSKKMFSGLTGDAALYNGYPERIRTGAICNEFSYVVAQHYDAETDADVPYLKTMTIQQYLSSDTDANTAPSSSDELVAEYIYDIQIDTSVTPNTVSGLLVTQNKYTTGAAATATTSTPVVNTWLYETESVNVTSTDFPEGASDFSRTIWTLTHNDIEERLKISEYTVADNSYREEIREIMGDNNSVISMNTKLYRYFDWGKELISEINGDPSELVTTSSTSLEVTTYEYNTSGNGTGLIKKTVRPDGSSVEYTYDDDGRAATIIERRGTRIYTTTYSDRNVNTTTQREVYTVTKTALDASGNAVTISKTKEDRGFTPSPSATDISIRYDEDDNEYTTTTYYVQKTGVYDIRIDKIVNSDGTETKYDYDDDSDSDEPRTIVSNGYFSGNNLVMGTITKTYKNADDVTLKVETFAVDTAHGTTSAGMLSSSVEYSNFDDFKRARTIGYLDGTSTHRTYGCCGVKTTTDKSGAVTNYDYDLLGRLNTVTAPDGIATIYAYDNAGRQRVVITKAEDNAEITTSTEYDSAGRVKATIDANGNQTDYIYSYTTASNGNVTYTETQRNPAILVDGNNVRGEIVRTYLNGELQSVTGSATRAQTYTYGPNWQKVMPQNIITTSDMLGRTESISYLKTAAIEQPQTPEVWISERYYYNTKGQLWKTVSPEGMIVIYEYDGLGRRIKSVIDMDRDGSIEDEGNIVNETVYSYEHDTAGNKDYAVTTSKRNDTVIGIQKRSLDGLRSVSKGMDNLPTVGFTTYNGNGQVTTTVTNPDSSGSSTVTTNGRTTTVTHIGTNTVAYGMTAYGYDKFGRVDTIEEKDGTGTSATAINRVAYNYDNNGNVLSETVGIPDDNPSTQDTLTTNHEYNAINCEITTTLPGNRIKHMVYYLTGELKREHGADTYPVTYTYNSIWGGLASMTTYQTPESWNNGSPVASAGNTTTWTYNTRGFMTRKTKANGSHVDYEYDGDGNVLKRTWARNAVTNYTYDNAGRLAGKSYAQKVNDVEVPDSSTPSISYTYDSLGRSLTAGSIGYAYNATNGYLTAMGGMTYAYDAYGRRQSATDGRHTTSYTYDVRNRIHTVGDGVSTATYGYDAKALPRETNISNNGSWVLTQTRNYDALNRLTEVTTNTPPVSMQPNGYNSAYTYNTKNQRETHTPSIGSAMKYEYDADDRGQLYTETLQSETVPERTYLYDLIGNRTAYTSGTTTLSYDSNVLNQYTTITSQTAPTYDLDGNIWVWNGKTFTWDGENRLKSVTDGYTTWEYAYDALDRRILESYIVQGDQMSSFVREFIWDGFNMHTETIGHDVGMVSSWIGYTWGKDLSDTLEGAGGVGGLLWQTTSAGETSYPMYDGNGNITVYVNAAGEYQAVYIYDGFLNVTQTGTASYRYQASTKSWNSTLGLLEYQFRDYSPELGRWIQEDPIEEKGGNNLYGFVKNNAINSWDTYGLAIVFPIKAEDGTIDIDKVGMARFIKEPISKAKKRTGLPDDWLLTLNPDKSEELKKPKISGCLKVYIDPPIEDVKLLALLAYGEGTANNSDDKKAIATVVMNRIEFHKKDKKMYKATISGVIKQRTPSGKANEFNAVNGDKWTDAESPTFPDSIMKLKDWNIGAIAAIDVYTGNLYTGIKDATVFHSDPKIITEPMPDQILKSDWDWQFIARVGNHSYFKIIRKKKK